MSLRAIAEADLSSIMEGETSFRVAVILTNPSCDTINVWGIGGDISELIDPDTGMAVSGRSTRMTIRMTSIINQGFELPEGISDTSSKPWLVSFDDITGVNHTFKVVEGNPDRTIGVVSLVLEAYKS